MNFQQIIFSLDQYWADHGCVVLQPYDMQVGAGTFHPATFLAAIGPEPTRSAYTQPSRRPTDGRYGENPNRLQHYFQYQVVLKPSPADFQQLYVSSLQALGIDPLKDDIRFVEDDWESPTLGAWGLGWEVWLNGMEITQITYFQQAGGLECRPVTGEITYGLERIAMYVQGVDSVFDLKWNDSVKYGDLYLQNEQEQSAYNFEHADTQVLFRRFETCEAECKQLASLGLSLPAYEQVLNASHTFNLLDARRVIGVTERARYIARVRNLARAVAEQYYESRQAQNFPRTASEVSSVEISCSPSSKDDFGKPEHNSTLLVEIGTEELPPGVIERLGSDLETELKNQLHAVALIDSSECQSQFFATPRRLAVTVNNVKPKSDDTERVRKGPPLERAYDQSGEPSAALLGFARSCGVEPNRLSTVETDKGQFVAYRTVEPGQDASQLIAKCLCDAIARLSFPKKMRWGESESEFIRPVHWIVVLHGEHVVPCELFSISSGRDTRGHRFHAPQKISIPHADCYESLMAQDGNLIASWSQRREQVRRQINECAEKVGANPIDDDELLNEVTSLVEQPFSFCGTFEKKFLEMPPQVLISSMRHHQKYFPLFSTEGKLISTFVGVANITPADSAIERRIATGNERVLHARLSDASFFWHQDKISSLEDKMRSLDTLVFHRRLGSVAVKIARVTALSKYLAGKLKVDENLVARTAALCKADLVTHMVGEFPDLQGIMGKHYALFDGQDPQVAEGIEEHYLPRLAHDSLPQTDCGRIVAIADRIDSIVGLLGAGEQVKGDRDPYSLRRMAFAVMRIIIESSVDIDLKEALQHSTDIYCAQAADMQDTVCVTRQDFKVDGIFDFMLDRLRTYYLDQGYGGDEFNAVADLKPPRPLDFDNRLRAVRQFRELPQFSDLIAGNKRISNILRQSAVCGELQVSPQLLSEPSELDLYRQARQVSKQIEPLIKRFEHAEILRQLAVLRDPIDEFFDHVMVMADDDKVQRNRIALVAFVSGLFREVADVSQLQPTRNA